METPTIQNALVENHRRFLAFVEKRVGKRDVAEEILQDAFVRGLAHEGELRDESSAVAWFYRLLRNALTDHFRREATRARAHDAAGREQELSQAAASDDELQREVCACIGVLLGTLKPEYADVLRRVELEGSSVQDYARAASITANNAGVRAHRAREALRKRLIESCGTCATHGCSDCSCSAPTPGSSCHS